VPSAEQSPIEPAVEAGDAAVPGIGGSFAPETPAGDLRAALEEVVAEGIPDPAAFRALARAPRSWSSTSCFAGSGGLMRSGGTGRVRCASVRGNRTP